MSHPRIKFALIGVVLAATVTVLAVSGMREGWVYFLPVDDFVQDDSLHERRVRLHGVVGEDPQIDAASVGARFVLCGESQRVPVAYTGVVPDQFKAGNDVVVEGQLDEAGVFTADTLMTKCASKYESGEGEAPHADPRAEQKAKETSS